MLDGTQKILEDAREFVRDLWRNKALREREHYDLTALIDIALIDAAEKAADAVVEALRAELDRCKEERDQFAEQAALRDYRDADMQQIMGINNELRAELHAELDRCREALGPFAEFADPQERIPAGMVISSGSPMARRQLTMGNCYAAVDALAEKGPANG